MRLGRTHGEVAIIERSALPSRSIREWHLHEWFGGRDEEDCKRLLGGRAERIRERIEACSPLAVISYGGEDPKWPQASGSVVRHVCSPTARLPEASNEGFAGVGEGIRQELSSEKRARLDHMKREILEDWRVDRCRFHLESPRP